MATDYDIQPQKIVQLTDNGYGIYFDKFGVEIISLKRGEVVAKGERRDNLFRLSKFGHIRKSQLNFCSFIEAHPIAACSSSSKEDSSTWHARLGHLPFSTM